MSQAEVAAILELPFEERFRLFELLWESLASKPEELPLSEEHRKLVEAEYEEYQKNPDDVLSHEEFVSALRQLR